MTDIDLESPELIETRTAQDIAPDDDLWRRVDEGKLEIIFMRPVYARTETAYVNQVKRMPGNLYSVSFRIETEWCSCLKQMVNADFELWVMSPRTQVPALKVELTGEPPHYFRDTQSVREALWVFLGEGDEWRDEWASGKSLTVTRVVMSHLDLMNAEMEQ